SDCFVRHEVKITQAALALSARITLLDKSPHFPPGGQGRAVVGLSVGVKSFERVALQNRRAHGGVERQSDLALEFAQLPLRFGEPLVFRKDLEHDSVGRKEMPRLPLHARFFTPRTPFFFLGTLLRVS